MSCNTSVSIIIPVWNEEGIVQKTIYDLRNKQYGYIKEILVIDGGSTDNTANIVKKLPVRYIQSSGKGRALQMNEGAQKATGNIFYFLHCDSIVPNHFDKHIVNAVKKGYEAGCFRLQFDSKSWFLKFWAYFTRFNFYICRGGDQSLFITRKQFFNLGKFDESKQIAEDMDFFKRIYRHKNIKFKVLPQKIITSARKYNEIGIVKLQWLFACIHLMLIFGVSQQKIKQFYSIKIQHYASKNSRNR
jgi:rSAM/selenodomain-associated transferase 2